MCWGEVLNIRGQGYLVNSSSTSISTGDVQDFAQLLGDRVPRPAAHTDLWLYLCHSISSHLLFPGAGRAALPDSQSSSNMAFEGFWKFLEQAGVYP